MALIGSKEYNEIVNGYVTGQSWLNDIKIDIEDGENEVDPIILMRAYEEKPSVDVNMGLAAQFFMNKHLTFYRGQTSIYSFTYTGGDLGAKFKGAPYLLDVALKVAYGLMLKKLTPPSIDSETEERQ